MEVKVLLNEKNTVELELVGADQSLAQILATMLNDDKDVEFASYKLEHPLLASPKIYVRTKKGDASKILLEKLDELKKQVVDFRKQFSDLSSG